MGLLESLGRHRPEGPEEEAHLRRILAFVAAHPDPFDRRIPEGHLTGSAFVVSPDGAQVLLLHHRTLGRWLQPGGHADPGERDGATVALREAVEETGITDLRLHPGAPRPLDVDVHAIPARGGDPAHLHLDLRYLDLADPRHAITPATGESSTVEWFPWDGLAALGLDPGLVRGLGKARRHLPPA